MKKQNSSKQVVGFLFGLRKLSPILSWSMIATMIVYTLLSATLAPIFVSQLLTHIANGTATLNSSVGLLVSYALILIFAETIAMRATILMAYVSETKMQTIIATRIFKHLTNRSLNYHSNRITGGMVSDANKLNGSIERFWDTLVFTAVPIVTTLISVCIVLSFILWQYALALAILSVIIITIIMKTQATIFPISRQVAEKSSAITAYLGDTIGNIAAVKAFAREKSELKQFTNRVEEWRKSMLKEMKYVVLASSFFGLMMTLMNISSFVAAIFATQYHIANIGIIYLVISYTLHIVGQLWSVSSITRNYIRVIGDAGPMVSTLGEQDELTDVSHPKTLEAENGKIEFDHIHFTHSENNNKLFGDFSLTINPGEQIGLVGKSGSGKTSLTYLLLRFSDLEEGKILINGQDISKVAQEDLHSAIAYVPQEPMLFHRTLRENISYGKLDATEEEIRRAAGQANALDFIESLPKGFETLVGERGVKLSGGQRQRIAIARAILKNAPILVLDEATSALDSENEKLIQDALTKLMKGRTSIVIAHRLSTIAKLDRIVVLDEGRIVEQGSHNELLKNNGIYSKLWLRQSGGFIK